VALTFDEVAAILGAPLPASASSKREWWLDQNPYPHVGMWRRVGWRVTQLDLAAQHVSFARMERAL
jgi:hypothetical protein